MRIIKLYFTINFLFFFLCSFPQRRLESNVDPEESIPSWISKRPVRSNYYVGIGRSEKNISSDYTQEAKKNALYDLVSEIQVNVSTNSILSTYSNSTSHSQNFNSLIRLNNSLDIEGYENVGSYDNGKEYWVYYELNKSDYEKNKKIKKNNAVSNASNLIGYSFVDEKNKDFTSCLKKRIKAFVVLVPYINEEIFFDESMSNGIKTIYDLTLLIQNQLQSLKFQNKNENVVFKPFKTLNDKKLSYKILSNDDIEVKNFNFYLENEDGIIFLEENNSSGINGDLLLNITGVTTDYKSTYISVLPDLEKLMMTDSIPRRSIALLKSFVEIPKFKIEVITEPIMIAITSNELNLDKKLDYPTLGDFIKSKFNYGEFTLIDDYSKADFIIELNSNTIKDISSEILFKNLKLQLAKLNISMNVKNPLGETLYSNVISDIYGYSGNLEEAGLNSYNNENLKNKLSESIFFLKRKIINN